MSVWAHFKERLLKGKNSTSACTGYTPNGSTYQVCTDVESGKACPLTPGLQVLHAYTMLTCWK